MNHRQEQPHVSVRAESDTAHPQSVVPIYQFHTLDNPFCAVPWCACHKNQKAIGELLGQISEGVLTLREAADFTDGQLVY